MHKIVIFLLCIVVIGSISFLIYKQNRQDTTRISPSKTQSGLEQARTLINLSTYKDTYKKTAPFYELPDIAKASEGYSADGKVTFAIYEINENYTIKTIEICEQFKKDMQTGEIESYCSQNGNLLLLAYAKPEHKNIISNIISVFAGEE